MFLDLQMGFSFITAAVPYAILERTSGFEPLSMTNSPRFKKLLTGLSSAILPGALSLDVINAVCHQFGLLSSGLHLIPCVCLPRLSTTVFFRL